MASGSRFSARWTVAKRYDARLELEARARSRRGAGSRPRAPSSPTTSRPIRAARSCIRSPTRTTPVRDPLGAQVLDRGRRRREEPARQVVGDDPVDLLGHPPIEAAQAGLDVRDGQPELGGDQRAGQRRVRVAVDQDGVRPTIGRGSARGRPASPRSARHACRRRRPARDPAPPGPALDRSCRPARRRSAGRCRRGSPRAARAAPATARRP